MIVNIKRHAKTHYRNIGAFSAKPPSNGNAVVSLRKSVPNNSCDRAKVRSRSSSREVQRANLQAIDSFTLARSLPSLSVSTVVLIALILDTGPAQGFDLGVWLTVPLFLMVAPATAIAAGGFVAARR